MLPVVRSDRLIGEYTRLCDGFLFCGGKDITPLLFGEEPCRGNGNTDITVDLFQIRLLKQILCSGKPVLAICRGMQILNAACGGTIWQDLSLAPGHTPDHMQKTVSHSEASHRIRTERGSLIREYFGPQFTVNSLHHQAINTPGTGIHVSARAKGSTIAAIELEKHPFAVGVQWHPECMYRTSRKRGLFSVNLYSGPASICEKSVNRDVVKLNFTTSRFTRFTLLFLTQDGLHAFFCLRQPELDQRTGQKYRHNRTGAHGSAQDVSEHNEEQIAPHSHPAEFYFFDLIDSITATRSLGPVPALLLMTMDMPAARITQPSNMLMMRTAMAESALM